MDLEFNGSTALQTWLRIMISAIGDWPHQEPPSSFQLSCLEALVDSGCPLSGSLEDAGFWLAAGIRTGSMAVVRALLRAGPVGFSHISQTLHGTTALEQATRDLCRDLAMVPAEQVGMACLGLESMNWGVSMLLCVGVCERHLVRDGEPSSGAVQHTGSLHDSLWAKCMSSIQVPYCPLTQQHRVIEGLQLFALQLMQPLEGLAGERVLWYCTVAPVLLAGGSPPAADEYLNHMSVLPLSCQEQLR